MKTKLPTLMMLAMAASIFAATASADPCGMVPPMWTGPGPAIERIGIQKTYVFYKDGVETFAVRPGFEGKVADFGMLIPVPSVPVVKKIADETFAHIAAAIDPPEVEVWVGPSLRGGFGGAPSPQSAKAPRNSTALEYLEEDRVEVVKEEAMGMYQVVVLDAGSAKALKRWMDEHEYIYPEGMDEVCQDYVDSGWVFVAIKAKVGQKAGVDPRPGMKDTDADRPSGSTFDGHVQGMAFRFKSDRLVVPMRLASYNEGEMHNVVYVLSDTPTAIRDIPKSHVKRQLSGEDLYLNLTQPLPLRIHGGDFDDIPAWQLQGLDAQRDPKPHNGLARELFAADLLASRLGELSLRFEEKEKELLNISERLGLRGEEIDRLHRDAVAVDREHDLNAVLMDLLDMTLTVVDGDFDRQTLRKDNLQFFSYEMPGSENNDKSYHATNFGPRPTNRWGDEGTRWVDAERNSAALEIAHLLKGQSLPVRKAAMAKAKADGIDVFNPAAKTTVQESENSSLPWIIAILGAIGALVVGIGIGVATRKSSGTTAVLLLLGCGVLAMTGSVDSVNASEKPPEPETDPVVAGLIEQLGDPAQASVATDKLVQQGEKAVPGLVVEAFGASDPAVQGWAIAALAEIGGDNVDRKLSVLHTDTTRTQLARTWAAAGRIAMTDDDAELIELAKLANSMPALGRPIAKKLVDGGDSSPEALISLMQSVPSLTESLQKVILTLPAADLAETMTTAENQNTRWMAASYLGAKATNGDDTVARTVVDIYAYEDSAKKSPWDGGALYVPGITWSKEDGTALVHNLLEWGVWCDRKEKPNEVQQIQNNLRSLGLARVVGYDIDWNNHDIVWWLERCGKALGRDKIEAILKNQGVDGESRFQQMLDRLE